MKIFLLKMMNKEALSKVRTYSILCGLICAFIPSTFSLVLAISSLDFKKSYHAPEVNIIKSVTNNSYNKKTQARKMRDLCR